MAKTMGYSKLTYSDIVNQITTRINSDPQFQTFRESAVAKTMLELFAGMTDMVNYYIERRAEESYLETAKLKSSVIQLSKQLGYVVQRPIPANASISMTLLADDTVWNSVNEGDTIQLPIYSSFTYGGNKFILKNCYTYTFTAEDLANLRSDPEYTKVIQYGLFNNENNYNLYKDEDLVDENDLITFDIIQAEKKYYFIDGINNEQIGKKFQVYNIPDTTFSNIYGSSDYNNSLTKVAISNHAANIFDPDTAVIPTSGYEYAIDRRSLLQTAQSINVGASATKVCLLRTNMDETIDLVFGDDVYAALGASLGDKDNISIQYASTLGNKGNQIGVIGDIIVYNGEIKTSPTDVDLTSLIQFNLTTDITNGADLEDVESIKFNAPSIFYSLDRCVTPGDYTAYLRTMTSPIIIRNAIAWGEQDEGGDQDPIEKLFNVALFSCFGELYRYNSVKNEWSVKESDTGEGGDMSDAVLDSIDLFGASPGGEAMPDNHYFYVVVAPNSPGNSRNIEEAALASPTSKLGIVYTNLKSRSQMTVKNVYVSPTIQEFSLQGTIFVNKMSDVATLNTDIQNGIYSFLNTNADFNMPVYLSNIIEIIEQNQGILYSNVQLVPTEISGRSLLGVSGQNVYDAVLNDSSIAQWLDTFVTPDTTLSGAIASIISSVWIASYFIDNNLDNCKNKDMDSLSPFAPTIMYKHQMTESWFWKDFINTIYTFLSVDYYQGFTNTIYWDQLVQKIRNVFYYAIRYNMMVVTNDDSRTIKDDIISYTLKTELPKITFEAGVMYK